MTTPRRGIALAEVAVALVVVVVGWAALVALQQRVVKTAVETALQDEARWTLQGVADSLELVDGAVTGRVDLPWGWVEWSPQDGGVSLRAWTSRDSVVAELWTWLPGTS